MSDAKTDVPSSTNDPRFQELENELVALREKYENDKFVFDSHLEACQSIYDERESLKLQIERMGRCVELIGIELSENGCDCKDDPPKNDCLACLIQKHLVALREIDGGGPEPG